MTVSCTASGVQFCEGSACAGDARISCSPANPCDVTGVAQFCVEGTCVGCADSAQCAGIGDGRDVCLRDRPGAMYGACVVCDHDDRQAPDVGGATDACRTAGLQVCDGIAHVCRECRADAECTSGICNAGTCIAAADIAYVTQDGLGATCTSAMPCATLRLGVAAGKPFVLVAPGVYGESLEIDINNRTVAIRATGATITRVGDGKFLEVRGSSQVSIQGGVFDADNNNESAIIHSGQSLTLDGVAVINATLDGVLATGQTIIRNSTIRGHDRAGVSMNNANAVFELTRSTVLFNNTHGVQVSASAPVIVNNVIAKNGIGDPFSALRIDALMLLGNARIEFNTIASNLADSGTNGGGVTCAATSTIIRNSIIHGNNGASEVNGCTVRFSTVEGAAADPPNGIVNTAPNFIDTGSNNFGLNGPSPLSALADPATTYTGASAVDIQGQARPMPAGSRGDLGADEIP